MSNPLFIPAGLVLLVVMLLSAAAIVRKVRARRRRMRRVVEKPNSHHTWERVREREMRERWHDMPLDRIHPVNRDEVVRLLARVQISGSEVLRPQERRFLEQMTELAGPSPILPPDAVGRPPRDTQISADLRHRTT